MESDLEQHPQIFQQQQHHHNQQQMNPGLMRYRSAPSSFFQEQIDREICSQFFKKPSSPETERIFARFMSAGFEPDEAAAATQSLGDCGQETIVKVEPTTEEAQIMAQVNQEAEIQQPQQQQQQQQQHQQQQGSYGALSQNYYQGQTQPPLPNQNSGSAMNYRGTTSTGMPQLPPMRTGGGLNTNLIRHSSSPAGLFADLDIEIVKMLDYGATGSIGNFPSADRLQSQANFPSAKPSSSSTGLMSPIAELENKNMKPGSPESSGFGEGSSSNYMGGYPISSWDNPAAMMPENVNTLKRQRDDDGSRFSGLNAPEAQSGDSGMGRPPAPLSHHLSLPKTLPDMSSMEKLMQFPDSVPCKIRAKRGCATHPRSIAERVRRTKISERMRRLQELVPNMDKQTNTAEMLDLAVDYIKELQRQVEILHDNRAKCTCSTKQQEQ